MKRFPKKFDFQIEYVKFASTILKQDFDWTIKNGHDRNKNVPYHRANDIIVQEIAIR